MISLSSCVAELRMGGVERNASVKAFQHTKEHRILSSESKVTIV